MLCSEYHLRRCKLVFVSAESLWRSRNIQVRLASPASRRNGVEFARRPVTTSGPTTSHPTPPPQNATLQCRGLQGRSVGTEAEGGGWERGRREGDSEANM